MARSNMPVLRMVLYRKLHIMRVKSRVFGLLGVALCIGTWLGAQHAKVDSLWQEFRSDKELTLRLDDLNELAVIYIRQNQDSALLLAGHIRQTSKEINYIRGQVNALVIEADVQSVRGQTEQALNKFNRAFNLALNDESRRSLLRVYNSRGVLYQRTAKLDLAKSDFKEGIALAHELNESKREAILIHNLALVLRDNGQNKKALENMERSKSILQSLGHTVLPELAMVVNSLGTLYQLVDQFDEAKRTYQEMNTLSDLINNPSAKLIALYNMGTILEVQDSLDEAMEKYRQSLAMSWKLGLKKYEGTIMDAMGNVCKEQGKFAEAAKHYEASLSIRISIADQQGRAVTLKNQADLLLIQKRYTEAIAKAQEAYDIGKSANLPKVMMESSASLHKAYYGLGQYDIAYQILEDYNVIKDSLRQADFIKQLNGMTADARADLEEKDYQLQIVTIRQKNEQQRTIVLIVALVITIGLSIALMLMNGKRKRANENLRITNDKLEVNQSILQEKNINLQSSNQQLEIANNKLQQFAFAANHDLKESLRAITSFGDLARKLSEKEAPDIAPHLQRIVDGGKRMNKTLERLMQYTDISPDPSLRQQIPLEEVVRHVKTSLSDDLKAANANLIILDLPTIHAQVIVIDQLFRNLIDNAIRYRHPEREPWIEIGCMQKEGQDSIFYVKDNGTGIQAEYLERIFQPFFRLHAPDKSGPGLGLAICKRIVGVYGGRIWASSQLDAGTTLFFTLPDARSNA